MGLPENSKLLITKEGDQLTFEFKDRSVKNTMFWFIMTGLWTFTFWGFLTNNAPIVFLFPIGVMMVLSPIVFLFFLVGKRMIVVDQDYFTFIWSLFGYQRTKKRNWKNLKEIRKVSMYKSQRKWVYGIGLYFNGEKKIKFGSYLSDDDRAYLMRKLEQLKK